MKVTIKTLVALLLLFQISCKQSETDSSTENQNSNTTEESVDLSVGQEGVQDEVSNPNIVQVASGSPDHTTLVAAVKAAGLVTSLSNAGPVYRFCSNKFSF